MDGSAPVNPRRWAAVPFFLRGLAGVTFVPSTVVHIARNPEHPPVFPRRGLAGHFRMGSPLQLVGKSQLFAATRTCWGCLPTSGS